jgi:hypothetical protein
LHVGIAAAEIGLRNLQQPLLVLARQAKNRHQDAQRIIDRNLVVEIALPADRKHPIHAFLRQRLHAIRKRPKLARLTPCMRQLLILGVVRIIHLRQRPHQHRAAIHGFPDLALEIDAEELCPRRIDEAIGLELDLDDVGIFRDRPERTIARGFSPMDRILAPQSREQSVLHFDVAIGLVVGKCIVQCDIEHFVSLPV